MGPIWRHANDMKEKGRTVRPFTFCGAQTTSVVSVLTEELLACKQGITRIYFYSSAFERTGGKRLARRTRPNYRRCIASFPGLFGNSKRMYADLPVLIDACRKVLAKGKMTENKNIFR